MCAAAGAGAVIWEHAASDAMLVEYDLTDRAALIESAATSCVPLLAERPPIGSMFGRIRRQNRNVGFFAADVDAIPGYAYAGRLMSSQPMSPELCRLLAVVNARLNASYNAILVNEYPHGRNYISAHRDDETGLDFSRSPGVFTLTWCSAADSNTDPKPRDRVLRIRDGATKAKLCDVVTKSSHGVLMQGADFQRRLTHEIPAVSGKAGDACRRRVSFTFRVHDTASACPPSAKRSRVR